VPASFVPLQRLQIRGITYIERKRAAVQSQVRRIVAALQLPEGVIPNAMHAFEKLAKVVHAGTIEAGTGMLTIASIVYGCRLAKVPVSPRAVIDACGMDPFRARRSLLRIAAAVREQYPSLVASVQSRASVQVQHALAIAREISGMVVPASLVSKIQHAIQQALLGLPDASVVGAIAYLAVRAAWDGQFKLATLARAVEYSPSSLYNCIARVLAKLGVPLDGSLGELDLAPFIQTLVGTGPVATAARTTIVQDDHEAPVIKVKAPAIAAPVASVPPVPLPSIPCTAVLASKKATIPVSCIEPITFIFGTRTPRPVTRTVVPFVKARAAHVTASSARRPRRRHDRPRWRFKPVPRFDWSSVVPFQCLPA
jgi:hypothetical protein